MKPSIQYLPLVITLVYGCTQDVGDIDRTQPYRIKKSVFDDEWYHQKTTFDVPYTAGFTFTGETSELERVKWQIEESYLIAYRSYELVENTKQSNLLPDVDFKGAPIAAYAITSHFDVVRDYNSLTGEETNVIYENTEDRPWYERSYIRVDWSKNLVINFNFMDDQVSQSPINYFVQDRTDEDRLLVASKSEGTWANYQDWREIAKLEQADYIDIVDTIFANPQEIEFDDGYGGLVSYPECWFYGATDCQPARVKIRSAFLKVSAKSEYEALPYPDNEIARDESGKALRDSSGATIRVPWFDKFGYFRVERYNYDRQREITQSGRTYLINRWNIWKDAPSCKQGNSYANCTVKPIEYYVSPNFPESLIPAARYTIAQWNEPLKEVVNHLKYAGTKSAEDVENVFILKANTYAQGQDRGQRIGDLRYSFLYYVPEPQAVSPLGYGPAAVDPKTGEIIQATAYVYGAPIESWATLGTDIVDLINGKLASTDLIEGEDVREYVTRVRNQGSGNSRNLKADEVRKLARSPQIRDGHARQKAMGKRKLRLDRGKIRAKLSAIENTVFEERLLNDEIIQALKPETRGTAGRLLSSLTPKEREQISPARWGTRGAARAQTERKRLKQRKNNLYLARNLDDAVVGLAERLKSLGDREAIRKAIMERMFSSVAEHEVGHTLGLRHNFGGSYDAMNYHSHYWELRGDNPQPLERPSDEQVKQGIREYQYASIMDYSSRFSADIHGIGLYDRAAIRFGYGQLVDTFTNPPNEPLTELMSLPYALHEIRHYTSYPSLFGGQASNMYQRKVIRYSELIKQLRGETQSQLVEVPYRFCSDEYEGSLNWCNTWDDGADSYEIVRNAADAYEDYYFFNSFARDQLNIEPWYHTDNVYYRYLIHPQIQYQHWVYEAWDESDYWESLREYAAEYSIEDRPYNEAADGGLVGLAASQMGINLLGSIVQAPEPGAYYLDTDDNTYYNYSYDTDIPLCPPGTSGADCSELNIPLGPGKYANSLYRGESGYYYYERLHVVGSFYDKLAAIQTLTSPETNFLGVDTDADISQYAISMYLYFPEQVTRLIGGSAVGDYKNFSGYVKDQVYYSRDMFAESPINNTQRAVDPATSFTVELYSAWLGMAFLNAGYDNSFNDLMQIQLAGNGEGFTPADPSRFACFAHEQSGKSYCANCPSGNKYSPACSLIEQTKTWSADASLAPASKQYYIDNSVAIMETIRGLHELYGKLYF